MNDNNHFRATTLPDIEIYGGDTTPWEVTLVRKDGTKYSVDDAAVCVSTLTFTPLKATTGLGNNAVAFTPTLKKKGRVELDDDGLAIVVFDFAASDTKGLRGKFLYQIEVEHNGDLRISQGYIYIKQNINR